MGRLHATASRHRPRLIIAIRRILEDRTATLDHRDDLGDRRGAGGGAAGG